MTIPRVEARSGTLTDLPAVPGPVTQVHGVSVSGVELDEETRCRHYDGERDVVALRFGCCESYYACYRCHEATAGHEPAVWPRSRFDEPAVLCGACGATLTPPAYFGADHECPDCGAAFNPGCVAHRDRYFEVG